MGFGVTPARKSLGGRAANDGANSLRALLWPLVGKRSAFVVASRAAIVVASLLGVAGLWLMLNQQVPAGSWGVLLLLSLFVAVAAQRDLRDRMQMISHIASHIGHKMNSPIAAVLNRIGGLLMHDNGDMDTATLRRELESIQEQLYAVSLITIGLTAFSNGNGADKKLVQMSDVLQNALHLMRLVDSQHKIQFNVDVDEPLPRILGDDITLEQCIVNICKNAVEAMPNGGRISITAKVDEMFPDFINIKIQDNGPGMTPDQVARAFEPFYTTKQRQHGLGLSVCFAVVSSHDGGIELSSREKSGTTVQIVLPIAQLN